MKYLYKFNESIERDIKDTIDNILLDLKDFGKIRYTLTDSSKSLMVDPYKRSNKRLILMIESCKNSFYSNDIKDEVETIIDFMKIKWGSDISVEYNSAISFSDYKSRYYVNNTKRLPGSFTKLWVIIQN